MPDVAERFDAIGRGRFALLVTFRRDGSGVATTVWLAPEGDGLVVSTPPGSGRVTRGSR